MREDERSDPISSKLRSSFLESTSLTSQICIFSCDRVHLRIKRRVKKALIGEKRFHLQSYGLKKKAEEESSVGISEEM